VALAAIHAGLGNTARSDEFLEKAVALDPRQAPRLYVDMASRVISGGEENPAGVERAVGLLQKAIGLQPGYADAYKRLGRAYWIQQNVDEAKAAFQRYLELKPDADDAETIQDYLDRLSESQQ